MKTKLLIASLAICGIANAQENWVKYPNNPVLKRDTVVANLPNDLIAISDCWVIKEGTLQFSDKILNQGVSLAKQGSMNP